MRFLRVKNAFEIIVLTLCIFVYSFLISLYLLIESSSFMQIIGVCYKKLNPSNLSKFLLKSLNGSKLKKLTWGFGVLGEIGRAHV